MNIEQMKYLIDISKTNSISNTARRLFISQQALSDSVRRLEKEFNCEILVRSRAGVTFTEAGKIILEAARTMVDQYEKTEVALQRLNMQSSVQGTLTVGIAPMAISVLLNDLMVRMHKMYPEIQLVVLEQTYDVMLEELKEGRTDIAIFGCPVDTEAGPGQEELEDEALQVEVLYEDELVCVMDKNNPLALQGELTMEELQGMKRSMFITSKTEYPMDGVIHYSNNTMMHQHLMQEDGVVTIMPNQAYLATFSQKRFIAKSIQHVAQVPTYLAYKANLETDKEKCIKAFVEMAHAAISGIA